MQTANGGDYEPMLAAATKNLGPARKAFASSVVSATQTNHFGKRPLQRISAKFGATLLRVLQAKSENLIGDRAYDSDPLDEELRND
jgi:hypothetical protein